MDGVKRREEERYEEEELKGRVNNVKRDEEGLK